MPVYEYECTDHGVFEQLRALAESAEPGLCPRCESAAPRVLSVPRLSGMPRATRIAHERNERSRHEPRHTHGGVEQRAVGEKPAARPALTRYTGARPWVIEHG